MLGNILLRHKLYQTIRTYLDTEGFIEVETPILTKSTPEGARDFLVPFRLSRENFTPCPNPPSYLNSY